MERVIRWRFLRKHNSFTRTQKSNHSIPTITLKNVWFIDRNFTHSEYLPHLQATYGQSRPSVYLARPYEERVHSK